MVFEHPPSFIRWVFIYQIDFDKVKDKVGKTAQYDTFKHIELEAGIKLEKYLPLSEGMAKIYVKPSVVQVISSGDRVKISGMYKLDTFEDGTLGRAELGGRYALSQKLSAYGNVNYTFGSDYQASSLAIGLNYNF